MWPDIIKIGTILTVTGGAMGFMFKMQQKKLDCKVDQTNCDIHLEAFKDILEKGDKKFEKITDKLGEIAEAVVRIDERTKKNNGGV